VEAGCTFLQILDFAENIFNGKTLSPNFAEKQQQRNIGFVNIGLLRNEKNTPVRERDN
jgi:hypothetical protein